MKRGCLRFVMLLVLVLGMLVACGQDGGGSASSGETAMQITGSVENEMAWTEEEVRSLDTIEAESENKEGETSTYTGVPVNTLLDMANPNADATTLVLVGDDGYTAEVPLDEVRSCSDCIVSFRNQGGFSAVFPGFSGKAQVKGLIEIQVQ
ncbi:MAG: molybdopterin-dependent oxidoreductase [Anaerolineae bacterium]